MNTRQLEYFLVLCRTRNISAASDELYLTRQALSKSIQSLEREVGTPLFTRKNTGIELTTAGTVIRDGAQQCMLVWNHALDQVTASPMEQTIRVGTHLMHMTAEAIDYVTAFQDIVPGVRIMLEDNEDYSQLFRLLRENRLDVVYARKHPEGADLAWTKAVDCDVYLMVNKTNPLASLKVIDFRSDLRGYICYVVSDDTMKELTPHANAASMILERVVPNSAALQVALRHNRGVFFAPSVAAPQIADDTIIARHLASFPAATTGYFVCHLNPPAIIKSYLEYLKGLASLPVHQLDEDGINAYGRNKKR